MAVLIMTMLSDRQLPPLNGKTGMRCGSFHHLDALRNHFVPDIVAE
jgi:hypothetical protein